MHTFYNLGNTEKNYSRSYLNLVNAALKLQIYGQQNKLS